MFERRFVQSYLEVTKNFRKEQPGPGASGFRLDTAFHLQVAALHLHRTYSNVDISVAAL